MFLSEKRIDALTHDNKAKRLQILFIFFFKKKKKRHLNLNPNWKKILIFEVNRTVQSLKFE